MNWQRHSKSYNVNEAFDLGESSLRKPNKETIRERTDSQSSVEDDDDTVRYPRGLPTKAHSIDFGVDDDTHDGRRSCCHKCLLMLFFSFFVLALMTCLAIILYFALINTVFVDSYTQSRNTLSGALTLEGSLLINDTYQPEFAAPESRIYRELENMFITSMNASFGNSSLGNAYDGTRVVRFEQGSIRIVFVILFHSTPNDANTEAEVLLKVQVTIGDGINFGHFDEFDVIENSLEIALVATSSTATTTRMTTTISTITTTTTATSEETTRTIPATSRLFSTHPPSLSTLSPTTPNTASEITISLISSETINIKTTAPGSTAKEYSTISTPFTPKSTNISPEGITGSFNSTVNLTTIPRFPNRTTTLTPSTAKMATSTTVDNPETTNPSITMTVTTASDATGNTTTSLTGPVSAVTTQAPPNSTTLPTTSLTSAETSGMNKSTLSITRIITSTTVTTSTESEVSIGATDSTNVSKTSRTTQAGLNNTTVTPTTVVPTTVLSSTPSTVEVNITRQPKIHPALPDVCGVRPAVNESSILSQARIVGGTPSLLGNWPWLGSLRLGTSHQCGAVLIHPEWAITADHCVEFFNNIVLGDIDLLGNTTTSPYRVQRNIQAFSNPDFDPITDNGDIALVRLTEPVEFNDYVQPLCINTLTTEMRSFNNCFVAGWGTDDILHQVAMRYQQEADIVQIDRAECSEWYQSYHDITDQHICAGEENGRRDSCSGDSGGPLQCQDGQGVWYLLGVVSFGEGCGQPRLPGVYARVSKLIPFLSQILDTNIKS